MVFILQLIFCGYNIKNKKLVINKKEAEIVRNIFNIYAKTRSFNKTAIICNKKGFRGKRGKCFRANGIKLIIQNKTYLGYNKHHNQIKKAEHQAIVSTRLYNICNKNI